MVSRTVYSYLNDDNKKLLSWNNDRGCYNGNIVSKAMNEWVSANQ